MDDYLKSGDNRQNMGRKLEVAIVTFRKIFFLLDRRRDPSRRRVVPNEIFDTVPESRRASTPAVVNEILIRTSSGRVIDIDM